MSIMLGLSERLGKRICQVLVRVYSVYDNISICDNLSDIMILSECVSCALLRSRFLSQDDRTHIVAENLNGIIDCRNYTKIPNEFANPHSLLSSLIDRYILRLSSRVRNGTLLGTSPSKG